MLTLPIDLAEYVSGNNISLLSSLTKTARDALHEKRLQEIFFSPVTPKELVSQIYSNQTVDLVLLYSFTYEALDKEIEGSFFLSLTASRGLEGIITYDNISWRKFTQNELKTMTDLVNLKTLWINAQHFLSQKILNIYVKDNLISEEATQIIDLRSLIHILEKRGELQELKEDDDIQRYISIRVNKYISDIQNGGCCNIKDRINMRINIIQIWCILRCWSKLYNYSEVLLLPYEEIYSQIKKMAYSLTNK